MGGYLSEEVPGSVSQETVYDEISLVSFKIHGVAPGVLGRCFIEVALCMQLFHLNFSGIL